MLFLKPPFRTEAFLLYLSVEQTKCEPKPLASARAQLLADDVEPYWIKIKTRSLMEITFRTTGSIRNRPWTVCLQHGQRLRRH
jgi:hypothetical protein